MDTLTDDRYYKGAPKPLSSQEQMDADLAADEMNRIVRFKEELTEWIDRTFPSTSTSMDAVHARLAIEAEFDDAKGAEYNRWANICGENGKIPSCDELRLSLARERRDAKAAHLLMRDNELGGSKVSSRARTVYSTGGGACQTREFDGDEI